MVKLSQEASRTLNTLCRKQMINKLLADILVDMTVCELEGWDKTEYINELCEILNKWKK